MTAKEMGISPIGVQFMMAIYKGSPDMEYWRERSHKESMDVERVKVTDHKDLPLLIGDVEGRAEEMLYRKLKGVVNV